MYPRFPIIPITLVCLGSALVCRFLDFGLTVNDDPNPNGILQYSATCVGRIFEKTSPTQQIFMLYLARVANLIVQEALLQLYDQLLHQNGNEMLSAT